MKKFSQILIVSSFFSAAAFAQESKTIEQVFTVNSGASFNIENINGPVTIEHISGKNIEVSAVVTAKDSNDLERIEIIMEQQGNEVFVKADYKNSDWSHNHSSGKVEFQVKLPANVVDTEVDLVNGSLKLATISGNIDADLVNGSIEATDVSGKGKFNSVNGSIAVTYSAFDNIEKVDIETVNGSIKLYLPQQADFTLDAETMHGNINTDFDLTVEKNFFTGKYINNGVVGNGTTPVKLESVNGSLNVLAN